KSDKAHIYNKFAVKLNAVVDLNTAFREKGYRGQIGARGAVAIAFNKAFNKSKRTSTSNWAMPCLSKHQLLYAANDAYAALCVYNELNQLSGK
ncbi:MAG: 3'-5' exonuclease domain-containing protein 2, partial [Gammaproteobacteria bacterium]|nr:3'-5' exonuclease domain-containing protein 2 [Gammaproteobacteria bacterium]